MPLAGVVFAAWQTGIDVKNAETGGDVAKAIGKGAGGYIAGTIATELILASVAGGPATLVAVDAGVGVAYGVGEVIEHWDDSTAFPRGPIPSPASPDPRPHDA